MIAEVQLVGHLTADDLEEKLAPITAEIADSTADEPCTLVVDCREMTGYDPEARAAFVEWNSEHRSRVQRVAIVTDKLLWHMVVSAMRLASRQDMHAFHEIDAAMAWVHRRDRSRS